MRLGREKHAQAAKTRPGLDLSTSAGRHRGALTVVEPTIISSLRVETLHGRRNHGDAPETTSDWDLEITETPRKQPRTGISHIFAAGDITGRLMLVPQAMQAGFVAATNAVQGATLTIDDPVSPIGSFTDPEYAQVGLTEAKARQGRDIITVTVPFDATTRTIIDGRTNGFCKLIVDRAAATILGCHVVGERAVEIVQVAAIAMTASMRVDSLARISLSFPTYVGILGRAAASAARQLRVDGEVPQIAEMT